MRVYRIELDVLTGFWRVWNKCSERVEAVFEYKSDAKRMCDELNKKAGV